MGKKSIPTPSLRVCTTFSELPFLRTFTSCVRSVLFQAQAATYSAVSDGEVAWFQSLIGFPTRLWGGRKWSEAEAPLGDSGLPLPLSVNRCILGHPLEELFAMAIDFLPIV